MFRPLAVNVGLRYARSRRSFISFVSALSLGGLALSVAILVFVQAVVAGFEREMTDRVLGIVPHVTISGRAPVRESPEILDRIRAVEGVAGASAVVHGAGLLVSGDRSAGVKLTGVDPASYAGVSRVFEFVEGARARGVQQPDRQPPDLSPGEFRVLVGAKIAQRLGIGVGDDISVVLPAATATPLGIFARQKKLRVSGLIRTHSLLDRSSAYLHRADAAKLFRLGAEVHGYHVAVDRPLDAEPVRAGIDRTLAGQGFWTTTWMASFGNLYVAIRVTKNMLFLLLSLLVAVASFNLVSSLVMIVNERRSDIAILRTMGSRSGLVMGIFVVVGIAIALIGIGLGVAAGLGLGVVAEAGFPWLEELLDTPLMGEYLITTLPMEFAASDIARVAATAMVLGLAATLLPAWRAARLNPADLLQHE